MSKADLEAVKDLITMKIAEKSTILMIKKSPANITDESKWNAAKAEAKKQYGGELPEDKFYSVTNHIYQNMGGKFNKTKESKKSTSNSHECPCGAKMKKLDDKYGTKPGWSKYECNDCGYSRDYRDGAPVYQAIRMANNWYMCESGLPLFSVNADNAKGTDKERFLDPKHGQAISDLVAKYGAYNAVKEWFVDGDGADIFHPGLKMDTLSDPQSHLVKAFALSLH